MDPSAAWHGGFAAQQPPQPPAFAGFAPPPQSAQPPAFAAAAPPPQQPGLGVLVPGTELRCTWEVVGGGRAVLTEPIPSADTVPDVVFLALPGCTLTADNAAVLYWTADGANWSILGAVAVGKPSALLRTGWGSMLAPGSAVQLAVSFEPMHVAANLGLELLAAGGVEERRTFARAIARDLWNFLASFSQAAPNAGGAVQSNGEMMLVPTSILDRWMERFDAKYSRDPNFMMKAES